MTVEAVLRRLGLDEVLRRSSVSVIVNTPRVQCLRGVIMVR